MKILQISKSFHTSCLEDLPTVDSLTGTREMYWDRASIHEACFEDFAEVVTESQNTGDVNSTSSYSRSSPYSQVLGNYSGISLTLHSL